MSVKHLIKYLFVLLSITSFVSIHSSSINARYYRNISVFDLQTNRTSKLDSFLTDNNLYVLVFHSLKCPFNTTYESKINLLSDLNVRDSVRFVYVNSNTLENDTKDINPNLTEFIAEKNNSYLLDKNHRLKDLFQIKKNGTNIICKKNGSTGIKVYYKGPLDDSPQSITAKNDFLSLAIERALEDKETVIDAIQTGCRITNH